MTLAATSWPDAAIALGGITFVTVIIAVATWQIFATGRAGMLASKEKAYRQLAETSQATQSRIADELGRMSAELTELRKQTADLQRVLTQVE